MTGKGRQHTAQLPTFTAVGGHVVGDAKPHKGEGRRVDAPGRVEDLEILRGCHK
jgi:hypothetical protein